MDQDVGLFQNHFHALGIGHEIGREIAAVELHTFDGVELGHHGLGLFHRDYAILADLLHGFGDDVADGLVAVGGNGANLGDHVAGHGLGELLDFFGDQFDGLVDAALEFHRVGTRRDGFHALAVNALCQDGGGRGTVAGHIAGLGGHFAHHLGAHVLQRILEFDLLGDRDTVLGDRRSAELLLQNHVPALRAKGHFHRVGELVHAAQNRLTRGIRIDYLFRHSLKLLSSLSSPLPAVRPESRGLRPHA